MLFLPLTRHERPIVDVLTDAVEVIRQLPEPVPRQTFAGMLGVGCRSPTGTDLDSFMEKLMRTPIGLRLLDELLEIAITVQSIDAFIGALPPLVA